MIACPACGDLFRRADALWRHLETGDETHREMLAPEPPVTRPAPQPGTPRHRERMAARRRCCCRP